MEISKTADHALAILVSLGEDQPCTPAQLARAMGLNRTVVHRLLATLHQRGFVLRQGDGYVLGTALLRLAEHVQPALASHGRAVATQLSSQVGETVVIHAQDGNEAVVLLQAVSTRNVVRVEHEIGSRHSLAQGASGRAILAFLDQRFITSVVDEVAEPQVVERQLEGVRRLGYALSHDELQHGVHGIAVPVFSGTDVAVASLAVLVPTNRAGVVSECIDALVQAGHQLSALLAGVRESGVRAGA